MYRKLICLVVVVLMANVALAGYVANWEGTVSADYNTGGNWDQGFVPIGSETNPKEDEPFIGQECKTLVDNWTGPVGVEGELGYVAGFLTDFGAITWPVISSAVPEIRELKIAHDEAGAPDAGYYGQLTVAAGADMYMDGDLEVGKTGEGILYITGGKIKVGDDCRVNSGTINMSGGILEAYSDEGLQLDREDNGTVIISGGLIDATEIEWNSTSTITLSGTGQIKLNGEVTDMFNDKIAAGQIIDGGEGLYAWYDAGEDHTYLGVPEPVTLALLGLGGFLIRRRRS